MCSFQTGKERKTSWRLHLSADLTRGKRTSHAGIEGKSFAWKENSKCKGFEMGVSQEAHIAGMGSTSWEEVDEVREVTAWWGGGGCTDHRFVLFNTVATGCYLHLSKLKFSKSKNLFLSPSDYISSAQLPYVATMWATWRTFPGQQWQINRAL